MAVTHGVTRPRNKSSRTFARCSILDRKARGNDASPGPKVEPPNYGNCGERETDQPTERVRAGIGLAVAESGQPVGRLDPLGSSVIFVEEAWRE